MPNVWFNGQWVHVDDNQLGGLATYGAHALLHNHKSGNSMPWQPKRAAPEPVLDQQQQELANRRAAVAQMQNDRKYSQS